MWVVDGWEWRREEGGGGLKRVSHAPRGVRLERESSGAGREEGVRNSRCLINCVLCWAEVGYGRCFEGGESTMGSARELLEMMD